MHICYLIIQVEGKTTCLHKWTIFRVAIKNELTFYKNK